MRNDVHERNHCDLQQPSDFAEANDLPEQSTTLTVQGPPETKLTDRDETILLVEDDDAMRELTRTLLRRCGYQVFTADSEPQALEVWERFGHQIDLLLTDVMIPQRSTGLDLARKLLDRKADLKVVYTSGFSADIGDGHTAFFKKSAFLQKPFTPAALERIIASLLKTGNKSAGAWN